ncbi:nuclear transport factor 2 family protein [Promicromonospora sp. NPDC090134]|uniref:nuclear transport factor 2 family protein n=1 Tax=Promicromonospora sp. NPDC090134 TaxID=3364408 RepID=UPI0037F40633
MTSTGPTTRSTLETAREFIRAVEAKDIEAVADTLRDDVEQLFMHSNAVISDQGVAELVAGRRRGFCVADVSGREEVLGYTRGIFDKFEPLVWRNHRWTVNPDGREVFFLGTGDMVVARTGVPYRNTYLTRFDVTDGKIVRMAEYGNAMMYARLGVRPNRAEFRSLLRAVGRMFSLTRSSRSGR